jgi:hypothetical protein
MFERKPSLPKHFGPVEWEFGRFRKHLSGFVVVPLAPDGPRQSGKPKKKRYGCILQCTCVLKPRDIRRSVVLRSVGPYFDRLIALLKLMMLTSCRQGQKLMTVEESYKIEQEMFEAKPRITAIRR